VRDVYVENYAVYVENYVVYVENYVVYVENRKKKNFERFTSVSILKINSKILNIKSRLCKKSYQP